MIVKCLKNHGSQLEPHNHGLFYTQESRFEVTIGRDYPVYAMAFSRGGFSLLLDYGDASPAWFPIELFEVLDGDMPKDWAFRYEASGDGRGGPFAVWGYYEMARDVDHHWKLTDHRPEHLAAFERQVANRERVRHGPRASGR